jgi:hypothetical protein
VVPFLPESISEAIVGGEVEEHDRQVGPCLIGQVRVVPLDTSCHKKKQRDYSTR